MEYLFDIADNHHIKYLFTNELQPGTPSLAVPSRNKILINARWPNKKELAFIFAHELCHVLNEDSDSEVLYYTAAKTRSRTEYCANIGALSLLIAYYFLDIDPQEANVDKFMNHYQIPPYLREIAIRKIVEYYGPKSDDLKS